MTNERPTPFTLRDWTVQFEPSQPPCPHCRMLVVRITTAQYQYYFCECELVSREQPSGRPVDPKDRQV